jgi:hypothetical protein
MRFQADMVSFAAIFDPVIREPVSFRSHIRSAYAERTVGSTTSRNINAMERDAGQTYVTRTLLYVKRMLIIQGDQTLGIVAWMA